MCRSSVVLTKPVLEILSICHRSVKVLTIVSAKSFGWICLSAAVFSAFWPCSSTPVRKKTSYPCSLLYRAIMSAAMVVYAWPMCGTSLI